MTRFGAAIALLAVLLLSACQNEQPSTVSAAAPPKAVATPAPPPPPAVADYIASGPLVVENQIDVGAQREGVVANILADVDTPVHKGQLLAELDSRELQANLAAAQAQLKSAQFETQHWEAETKVRESDLSRDEELFKYDLITAKQVEHSRYSVAGAEYETERQRQDVRNAEETIRGLELEVEKTHVLAPFDGVVARRYIRVGQKIAVGDRLFWVTATAPLNVKFTLPQQFIGKIKAGEQVTVIGPAAPDKLYPARVKLVSPVVDPSSETIEVQAQVLGSPAELRPGMSVNVRVKP